MKTRILAVALVAAAASLPVSNAAHAGFWTDVAKGSVKNSIRHTKQSAKKAKDLAVGTGAGVACLAAKVVGRCQ